MLVPRSLGAALRTPLLIAALIGLAAAALLSASRASAQASVHVVRAGDTLIRIARRHRVSVADLRRENRLRSTEVRAGQRLRIPGRSGGWQRARVRRHTVRPGDSLARIARRFRVSIEDLRAANALRGDTVRVGETLNVPRAGQSGAQLRAEMRAGNAPREADEVTIDDEAVQAAEARASELHIGSLAAGQLVLREAPDAAIVAAAGSAEALSGTLLQPVEEGRFLRGWGSGVNGYHLAVDIGAPPGTEVHAAEAGIVVYVGRGIRGYGNIVILVHPNGWVTAYAHHRQNRVVGGQLVARGDVIGTVGQTGFARGPHLHMIFAFDGEHCDPVPLFRPRMLDRRGEEVDEPELVWDTDHRPSGIRCDRRAARPHPLYSRRGRRRRR